MTQAHTESEVSQITCRRCKGTGYFDCYAHVQYGCCFECGGRGTVKIGIFEDRWTESFEARPLEKKEGSQLTVNFDWVKIVDNRKRAVKEMKEVTIHGTHADGRPFRKSYKGQEADEAHFRCVSTLSLRNLSR